MAIFEKFINRRDFTSYEDFKENFQIRIPEHFNFAFDILDVLAETKPEKEALLWCNDIGEERHFTYKDISRYSNKTANYFVKMGIKKGDKVMLVLKRHYQFWFCIMALHKIGAIAIPATHLLTAKDIVYRNVNAGIKAIVCTSDHRFFEEVDKAQPKSPSLELKFISGGSGIKPVQNGWNDLDAGIEYESDIFERPQGELAVKNDDVMLLYFTSGTSGFPKMVIHDYAYPLGHIITSEFWQSVKDGGLHLTVAETGWAKAVWGKLYGQWLGESSIFVYDMDKFDPIRLLEKMEKYNITTFCAPPTIYRFLMLQDLTKYDLSSLKELVVAGEALNPEIYTRMLEATGIKMREAYGQTELIALVCTFPWIESKPGSMGKPSPCYKVDICGDDMRSCFPGEIGEIVVDTSESTPVGMFKGYYEDDVLTRSVWHDGIYHTGDLAYRDEKGYYWYVGRKDDVIKSSGYRIGPFEVESVLLEHPAVMESAVTGVPDPVRGQLVKATIKLAPGYAPSDELAKDIQNFVKKNTAPYKYPRIIDFVDEIPKTISGKMRHSEIRDRDKKNT